MNILVAEDLYPESLPGDERAAARSSLAAVAADDAA